MTLSFDIKYVLYNDLIGVFPVIYYTDGTKFSFGNQITTEFKNVIYTTPNDKTVDYIIWYYATGYAQTYIKNIQLKEGELAASYEPYIGLVMTNIYLVEPLRCIEDNCDYIDYENNQIVRKIKSIKLTGKESWKIYSASNVFQYPTVDEVSGPTTIKRILSTHFIGKSWSNLYNDTTMIGVSRSSSQIRIRHYENCNNQESLDSWKNYLVQKKFRKQFSYS